jgi:hypothetical protein
MCSVNDVTARLWRLRAKLPTAVAAVVGICVGVATVASASAQTANSGAATASTRRQAAVDAPAFVPGLDDVRVQMLVSQQSLTKTLEVISEQTQLKITVSKGLAASTSRLRIDGTGRMALDAVANQAGAIWWWNGSEVRMVPRNDIVAHSVKARDIDYAVATARQMGLPMDMVVVSKPSGRQTVRISGPAGLLADFEALNDEIGGRLSNVSVTKFGKRRVVKLE